MFNWQKNKPIYLSEKGEKIKHFCKWFAEERSVIYCECVLYKLFKENLAKRHVSPWQLTLYRSGESDFNGLFRNRFLHSSRDICMNVLLFLQVFPPKFFQVFKVIVTVRFVMASTLLICGTNFSVVMTNFVNRDYIKLLPRPHPLRESDLLTKNLGGDYDCIPQGYRLVFLLRPINWNRFCSNTSLQATLFTSAEAMLVCKHVVWYLWINLQRVSARFIKIFSVQAGLLIISDFIPFWE